MSHEHVLVVGDADRQIYSALIQALPAAQVRSVATIFDAIAELTHEQYTTVLAAAEPIERRPEAAVQTLRELGIDSRLLLFGHPTLEPLSQKMMEFGCDDYLVTPVTPSELMQVINSSRPRRAVTTSTDASRSSSNDDESAHGHAALTDIPLADIVLDALVKFPQKSVEAIIERLNRELPAPMQLSISASQATAPAAPNGMILITQAPAEGSSTFNQFLHLAVPDESERASAEAFLWELSRHLAPVQLLQERHVDLQRLIITDDLTGLANGRYFRHFVAKVIEKARIMCFPVTLFLFDIDNFKKYNDQYGHGVGDEILKQTAALMRRCVRDHDLVARISGDEFAVVFWEKDGPRQPREPNKPPTPSRTPKETQAVLDRFRRLVASQNFPGLGPAGKGSLTISGGIAVYPWNANDADGLIDAADRQLMFGAKRSGKNSIYLVGGECLPPIQSEPPANS